MGAVSPGEVFIAAVVSFLPFNCDPAAKVGFRKFRLIALRAFVNIRVRISGSSHRWISVIISILIFLTSRCIASVAFD